VLRRRCESAGGRTDQIPAEGHGYILALRVAAGRDFTSAPLLQLQTARRLLGATCTAVALSRWLPDFVLTSWGLPPGL
jgi:hypothetical protein